jgi:NAD(P)-dependent dehydrogenase (short-subunit alcohol dehydrogenase family)
MADELRLDGKVALITGAAGEIGTATMQLFAARGARIVAVDRNEAQLQRAVAALPAEARALAVAADVTREDDVAAYVRRAVETAGTIDVFFNNAGIEGDVAPIQDYTLENFRRVLDVNVVGVFLGIKHVLPVMLKANAGSIVNTASIAGLIGSPHIAVYSASKHAVIGLTKSVAMECSTTRVRVNCVCPGLSRAGCCRQSSKGATRTPAPIPKRSSPGYRRTGSAFPPKWPRPLPSWPPTPRAMSAVRHIPLMVVEQQVSSVFSCFTSSDLHSRTRTFECP